MLQLILGILKVIGILLLAVFLLLLLSVLALLFVPVRYEAAGKKKKGALAARIKIFWRHIKKGGMGRRTDRKYKKAGRAQRTPWL